MKKLYDLFLPAMRGHLQCEAMLNFDIDENMLYIDCFDEKGDRGAFALPMGLPAELDAPAHKPLQNASQNDACRLWAFDSDNNENGFSLVNLSISANSQLILLACHKAGQGFALKADILNDDTRMLIFSKGRISGHMLQITLQALS